MELFEEVVFFAQARILLFVAFLAALFFGAAFFLVFSAFFLFAACVEVFGDRCLGGPLFRVVCFGASVGVTWLIWSGGVVVVFAPTGSSLTGAPGVLIISGTLVGFVSTFVN